MSYFLHNIHFILGLLLLLLYIVRGAFMFKDNLSQAMQSLSAVLDLMLFGTGLALVFASHTMSFANSWVMTKIMGTLFFVAFAVMAFKTGQKKSTAIILWLLGLFAFIYTFIVAKGLVDPLGV